MLKNLSERVCVSQYSGKDQALWACYEPSCGAKYSKRQVWKRLTGLLSTSEMQRYLEKNYSSSEVLDSFDSISA